MSATVILTSYRRPENLVRLVSDLRLQTLRPEIFIWDNGQQPDLPEVDLVVRASSNLFCWPRWTMAAFASHDHCFVMDDDMRINDPRLLEVAVDFMDRRPDVDLIGLAGVCYTPGVPYESCRHLRASPNQDRSVDMVKGQFVGFRKEFLGRLPILPPTRPSLHDPSVEDDIAVSAYARVKVLPQCIFGKIAALQRQAHALCSRPDHLARRQSMREITQKTP
jgi:hypothetical protein